VKRWRIHLCDTFSAARSISFFNARLYNSIK